MQYGDDYLFSSISDVMFMFLNICLPYVKKGV